MASGVTDAIPRHLRQNNCIIHVLNNAKVIVILVTFSSWCNFSEYTLKWRKSSWNEGETAAKAKAKLSLRVDFDNVTVLQSSNSESYFPIPAYCKFHRECYNRHCSKQIYEREEKRHAKREKHEEQGMNAVRK